MKKLIVIVLTVFLLPIPSLSCQTLLKERKENSTENGDIDIVYPLSTYPAIVEKGKSFTINFSLRKF
ncbi:MAG: hypothetical protein FE041_02695 [Thermoplasmata archaeon]|nr:MAG: hypothetical protein FE041_02695 [Thermoplasmata archaeon]